MRSNRSRSNGSLAILLERIWAMLIACLLAGLTALTILVMVAKAATNPQLVKFMAATGAGALYLITSLSKTLNSPELHEQICQGYAIIFGAYFLHFIDDVVIQAEGLVGNLRRIVSTLKTKG